MPAPVKAPGNGGAAQAVAPSDVAQARRMANLAFITNSRKQQAVCPPSSGSGNSQPYAAGTTLIYDVPTGDGAFLTELLVICNINLTLAAGSAALYALTPSAPFSLFDSIQVVYGQTQATLRPVVLRYLAQMKGFQRPAIGAVIAGEQSTAVQNAIYGTFGVTSGAQAWNFYFRVPLDAIPHTPSGYLPIQGDSTKCQVKIITTQAGIYGQDPLLNPICIGASGTGQAVTVAANSTVQVVAIYKDGIHKRGRKPLALDLTGEPTTQYIQDRILNPLVPNLAQRTRLDSKLVHAYVIGILIDGNQSTSYTVRSNITGYGVTEDSTGANKLLGYGNTVANNVPIMEAWEETRKVFGQDFDDGVIPFVYGPAFGQYNASNGMGTDFLDMTATGWNDANLEVWLSTVGTVCTPRLETFLVSLNSAGLVRAGG